MRQMGPLSEDHPLVNEEECPACKYAFELGEYVTLVSIGPGPDPEEQAKAREGRPYNAIAIAAHWICVTGEEPLKEVV